MIDQDGGFGRDPAGRATLGGTPVAELLEQAGVGTPAYLYDLSAIAARASSIVGAFGGRPHLVAYAMKANSAASIIRAITQAGAGVDAVSGGELRLARQLDVPGRKIVLSGVAKQAWEIDTAIAEDILALQAESPTELDRIAHRAQALGRRARVSLRINPAVKIDSHAHIATGHDDAKFGIARQTLPATFESLESQRAHLQLVGVSTHVGSMLKTPESYVDSGRVVCEVAQQALERGHQLEYVDFGGGFGIDYGGSPAAPPADFAAAALALLDQMGLSRLKLVVEPGRSLVGPYGIMVSQVVQTKRSGERRWLMIDAGMNDVLRPALYQARHRIEPVDRPPGEQTHRVVGPVCESTDDFGSFALGPAPSHVVIRDVGAYCFTMASEYNARPLPSEVFVEAGRVVRVSPSPGVDAWIARRLQA